ncbi:bifunctional YncE family protein/alkaline phosphatase family protein [Haliscomenobacter hydrossis]|uniref:40-residue YVTN family beta-propeller repeat protein n=1 Tax=Haliscomenobacter hydrossis (strain ATCC 27775 / DSM 1100 / LMG 10767 / O) TaxID=760192 RepID=F4KRI8_HALH1|nr:beta-propeller fold lactonase family protein [Haliscomenobacter hydrossis]AEE47978.1 40-residue YVTN family beta-propeller repeat protein [Haliscomenobacter hydrossis DSM 1100]
MRHKYPLFFGFLVIIALTSACNKTKQASLTLGRYGKVEKLLLPNGWSLTPLGKQIELGDLPLNLVLSADQTRAAISNNGQSKHSLMWIDVPNQKVLHELDIPKAWYGLALTKDAKTLYASAGYDNMIKVYSIENDRLKLKDSLVLGNRWPRGAASPAGLALSADEQHLYCVTKGDSALYDFNVGNKTLFKKTKLKAPAYTCNLGPDGKKLYITLWGASSVGVYDTETAQMETEIAVGSHPNEMVFSKNGALLFVASADDNAVSVIDLTEKRVVETIVASLYPDAPIGSTSNSIAISEDGKTLAVANADNNCLALFDVSEPRKSKSLGFVPTGWYPTSVRFSNNNLLVINGKGLTSKANPNGPNPYKARTKETEYIAGLFKGTLSVIPVPTREELPAFTRLVYQNTPYEKNKELVTEGEAGNPIPRKVGEPSPIKYVFYIIKENRTYDQVFGDMKEGNGDPSLCLFPDTVSPNMHALAREFVLLDNFYVDAEVSADGHNWSTSAYANDYVEKNWPTSYGGRGGTYDYEGSKSIAWSKGGFLWDKCKEAGLSYRSYGIWADYGQTYMPNLKGHLCTTFAGYNLAIQDILRFERWKTDFDSLQAINQVPRMNFVRFGNDHTAGARVGVPSPAAMVADNDLAVGRFVEHLSKSKIWKESAVFVVEDDAQNGPDHVDAHRSPCLVISPYTKRKHIEHSMYSTSSVLRTMELILGLTPMSQYDAAAKPMYACFTRTPDYAPYEAKANQISLTARNTIDDYWSKLSYQFNLEKEDRAPDMAFTEVIWKAVRGRNAVVPAPRRSAFVIPIEVEAEDED